MGSVFCGYSLVGYSPPPVGYMPVGFSPVGHSPCTDNVDKVCQDGFMSVYLLATLVQAIKMEVHLQYVLIMHHVWLVHG